MIRRTVICVSAVALTFCGTIASGGVAHAAGKTPVDGTLHCASSGFTTITPGILLVIPNLPNGKPGKDKKPKYISTGDGTACTGTATAGVKPSSVHVTSKSKGLSRSLIPAASCSAPDRVAKAKFTFDTKDKLKVSQTTGRSFAFNATTHVRDGVPAVRLHLPGCK